MAEFKSTLKIQYQEHHKVSCACGFYTEGSSSHAVVKALADHIESVHPNDWAKLVEEGRRNATALNGCGYYDDGRSESPASGWAKSSPDFRRAHIEEAMRYAFAIPVF